MLIKIFSYIPAIIGLLIIGLTVYINNPKDLKNKIFAGFNLVSVFWLIFLFISDIAKNEQVALWSFRLGLLFGQLAPYVFYLFVLVFPKRSDIHRVRQVVFGIAYVGLSILALTPLNVSSVTILEYGVAPDKIGFLYNVSDLLTIVMLALSVGILIYKYQKTKDNIEKQQVKLVLWAAAFVGVVNIITGFIFLRILQIDSVALLFGNIAYLIFSILIAYTIISHKLFDVRLIVARALGYIFTLTFIAGGYSLVILIISAQLFKNSSITFTQQVSYIIVAIFFGYSLPPLKNYFDHLTKRLFYRDAYESQVLLDELNKILVGNIDIQPLLRQCAELFETTLKSEFCTFIIKETDDTVRRVIGSKKVDLDEEQILELSSQNHKINQIIVADEIEDIDSTLKTVLRKNNVSILARLAPAGKNAVEQGYLVLGAKRSGNPYNKQDLQVLDIIANELVIAIQNALRFEEIEAFTVTLQEKVNDATRQLRRTNEKLKALDETKDEFISMASHQLRTPLTAVKGYVSMVVEGDAGKLNKQQKELLDQAFASSQRMVYLIADLLNVSRLKTGKFVIENKQTNLAEVVEAEIEQLKQAAAGKQQTLTYTKPAKFPDLMLDETKMRQVIMNFTDNALHYTPNGGHITVNLEDKGQSVEFTVVDDGLGVPKSEQHHLFGKFYRAGNARKARPDGTGLGLFMAKKVIIAQGGAVIFSSTEGKGSTFGFTMPKK